MGKGYVSIHREINTHWVWNDKPFSKGQAWIDLILLANHSPGKILMGNTLVNVERGQVITSEVKLMTRWGWSKSKVRAFLLLLENDKMIDKKTDSKKTDLTICNYCDWQDTQTKKEPEKNQEKTAKEPGKDTINKDNNLN